MSIADELRTAEAIAKGKDPAYIELERLAAELHAKGVDFSIEGGRVVPARPDRNRETSIDLGSNHVRLGVVSDTHLGSRFEQLTALRAFYDYADERQVDAYCHVGDVFQGPDQMHKGMELEVHAHGADAQVDYGVRVYPKSKRAKTYAITGNHDDSFLKDGGINVVRRFCDNRPDFVYAGQDAAYLNIGPLRLFLIHPDGGGSYAKSYKPQKIAASLPLEERVRLLLIGHYHVRGSFREKDTETLMLPCFQAQYAWLARKALHPDIGGYIVDIDLTDDGRIARFATEYVDFPVVPDDWDQAASNAVSRGWSAKEMD